EIAVERVVTEAAEPALDEVRDVSGSDLAVAVAIHPAVTRRDCQRAICITVISDGVSGGARAPRTRAHIEHVRSTRKHTREIEREPLRGARPCGKSRPVDPWAGKLDDGEPAAVIIR